MEIFFFNLHHAAKSIAFLRQKKSNFSGEDIEFFLANLRLLSRENGRVIWLENHYSMLLL